MLRPGTFALTALLSFLTGIGPLSVDMYLASWPEIGRLLQASPGEVQLTLSVYLVGFGLAQLIYGPLSDRHGRKPVLLAAVAIYTLASIACMVAPSIEFLIVARFIQAIGGSGILILPRAIARDLHDGVYVARELSRIAAVMALTPVIAPLIGAVLQVAFGWR
jgi:DHA1 family bicyclomycin/chloramphenicol resistance-like MFS transporter